MPSVRVRLTRTAQNYPIQIEPGILAAVGERARKSLDSSARNIALISNKRVFKLYGKGVVKSLNAAGFQVAHWLMKEGERHKSLRSFQEALAFLSECRLERNDAVVALGGGVVGDLA